MPDPIPEDKLKPIRDALLAGRKIEAIKLYREQTGFGLKESKDFVDELERDLRRTMPEMFRADATKKGCAGVLAGVIGLLSVMFGLFLGT
jgi:ribosomal protein L7/L12